MDKKMNISFVTNIISAHQMELWDRFVLHNDINFSYIYTTTESEGKRYEDCKRDYCIYSKDIDDIEELLDKQDILILSLGSIEDDRINKYIKGKGNLIIYSEHLSKNIDVSTFYKRVKYLIYHCLHRPKYHRGISRNNIVLSSSSHTGYDFHITGFKKNNIYRFGYFPKYQNSSGELSNNHSLIFSGRNIYWKHAEDSFYAVKYLNENNYKFILNVAGNGFDDISKNNNINPLGELNHNELNNLLVNSDLFIFSSTREEGWGVALPEAMAAGCFVIANVNAGSTNYLVKNGYNGFTYKNRKQLTKRLNQYMKLSFECKSRIRHNAINTIKDMWNAEVAATRLYELCCAKTNKLKFNKYKKGPLSKDPCKL